MVFPKVHQVCEPNPQFVQKPLRFFCFRAFLTAECSVARTALLVSLQALGTMLAIYIPAAPGCAEERAKSKPVSLQKGWKSAVVGGAGDFSEDLTDGRGIAFEVVAARWVLVKEGCCKGMHGRMRKHNVPTVDQGVGEGVAQKGWGLAGFGAGGELQESCNPKDNKAASPIPEEFGVGAFFVPPRVPESCAFVLPSPNAWAPGSCEGGNQGCVDR